LQKKKLHIAFYGLKLLKKKFLGKFLFIFLINFSTFSQINLYSKLEKIGYLDCSSQAFLFVDSTAKLPLQNISIQSFLPLKNYTIPKSLISSYRFDYWLKFTVKNPTPDTLDLLLTTGLHQSNVLFQLIDNQIIKTIESNEGFHPKQRKFKADDQYLPLRFLPNQTSIFFVKINDYPREDFVIKPILASKFWANHRYLKAFYDEYAYLVVYGGVISILFFVALFVLMFYFLDRQPYYLYYAFYLFSIGLFNLWEYEHSAYNHLIFSYLPILKFTGNSNIYVFLTHIFYFQFIFAFLELKVKFPKTAILFHWVIIILSSILLVDIFILFVLKRLDWSAKIYWFFEDIFPILNIILLFMIFRAKGRIARNIQIGSTFLMIGGLTGFLTHYFIDKHFILLRIDPSIIFVSSIIIEVFFFSIAIGTRSYNIQKEQKSLYKYMMESELRTLRSQVNPHFVFNSLNSIKSYILTHRSTEAAEYLTDFSTLMRSILQYSKEQLISLSDELEITLLYVSLEQRRFGDNFLFIYEIDPDINIDEVLIPPMLLQPYIENSIKHGLMNKEGFRKLILKIMKKNKNYINIIIEDNGIGREQASLQRNSMPKYQSMGMNINDERISLLGQTNDFKIEVEIVDKKTNQNISEGTQVIIRIPIG
jgi:sensor histidine kinase YesM